MIIPDTNLLIYALDLRSPHHEAASRWWRNCLNDTESIGLTWQVVVSVLRITSSPRLLDRPVPIAVLLDQVDLWLRSPAVEVIEPRKDHVQAMRSIAEPLGLAGDVMNDVHLAALALEYGAVVHTADRDFARFKGVRWFNPLG